MLLREKERIDGLCSVIMPAYNAEKYIKEAIESVLMQSYKNFELIIIEDNSSDNTRSIIKECASHDKRIIAHFNKENKGCANSRNIGLSLCHGEYMAFIDSDDVWLPKKLEMQIEFLNKQKKDMVYTAYEIIDSNGCLMKSRSVKEKLVLKDLLKENSVIFSTTCFRYYAIKDLLFKQEWFHEDYVYLLDCLKLGLNLRGMNESFVLYRVHSNGRSFNKIKAAYNRWRIYREYLDMGVVDTIRYFIFYTLRGVIKYI